MTQKDLENKQIVFIDCLKDLVKGYTDTKWLIKAEYSTDLNDKRVIVVQEQNGNKQVFYGDIPPLYDYYMIDIYGLTIQECKNLSLLFGQLIGKQIYLNKTVEIDGVTYKQRWQIIFGQYSNPQAIEYMDIRRIGYNATMKCIVNKIYEERND